MERDQVGVDTPALKNYLPVVVNWRSNFVCCMIATVTAICPSEKHFFFFYIFSIVPHLSTYSIQVINNLCFIGKYYKLL